MSKRKLEPAVRSLIETQIAAVRRDPAYAMAHHLLGRAYRAQGNNEAAQREFQLGERAELRYLPDPLTGRLELLAVNSKSRTNRAARLLQAHRFAEGAKLLEGLIQSDPSHATAMNNFAIAYVQLGRSQEALEMLQRARMFDDRKYTTYVNLASWAVSVGKFDDALGYANGAVERGT